MLVCGVTSAVGGSEPVAVGFSTAGGLGEESAGVAVPGAGTAAAFGGVRTGPTFPAGLVGLSESFGAGVDEGAAPDGVFGAEVVGEAPKLGVFPIDSDSGTEGTSLPRPISSTGWLLPDESPSGSEPCCIQ